MKRHITSMKCYFWEKHHLDFCENTAPETIVAFFGKGDGFYIRNVI